MKSSPLVSIVVPVYNAGKYLNGCLDSIASQDYKNLEVIIVNDGSDDGSAERCRIYEEKDKRFRVIDQENKGVTVARLTGTKAAKGEFIVYVDADDWMDKQLVSELVKKSPSDIDVVYTGDKKEWLDGTNTVRKPSNQVGFYRGGNINRSLINSFWREDFSQGFSCGCQNGMYRRTKVIDAWEAVDSKIHFAEDVAMNVVMLAISQCIGVLHIAGYHYRVNTSSAVHKGANDDVESFILLYKHFCSVREKYTRGEWLWPAMRRAMLGNTFCVRYASFEKANARREIILPYHVKKGKKVVLYGGGAVGIQIEASLSKTEFCQIVGWLDRNANHLRHMTRTIEQPEMIQNIKDYEAVIVCMTKANIINSSCKTLSDLGVPKNKIFVPDISLFNDEQLLQEIIADMELEMNRGVD